jgi:hypothetical protein
MVSDTSIINRKCKKAIITALTSNETRYKVCFDWWEHEISIWLLLSDPGENLQLYSNEKVRGVALLLLLNVAEIETSVLLPKFFVANRKFCVTSVGGGSLNDYRRVTGRLVAVGGQQASGPLVDGMCLAMKECATSRSAVIAAGRVLVFIALLVSTPVRWVLGSAGSLFQCIACCG